MSQFPLNILKSGIKLADKLTKGVQSTVQIRQFTGESVSGAKTYSSPVKYRAIVNRSARQVFRGGQLVMISGQITILTKISPNGATTKPVRREPIDPRDLIILSDGTVSTILSAPGAIEDAESGGGGLITKILLG